MKKTRYLMIFLLGLVVMFFAQDYIAGKPEAEMSTQRVEWNDPVAQISLGNIGGMFIDWESAGELFQVFAEMGYCEIELNGARISLPCLPMEVTDQKDQVIIPRKDVPQANMILGAKISAPLPPESQYDFDLMLSWCSRYKNEPISLSFGNGVAVDVVVRVIQVLNQHNVKFYLRNTGLPFGMESPTSIKLELNNSTGVRVKV